MMSDSVSTSQDSVRDRASVLQLSGRTAAVEAGPWCTEVLHGAFCIA